MKIQLLLALCLGMMQPVFSQEDPPPYKLNKTIPGFELKQSNKVVFHSSKLKKNTGVIIMFFSPGCDHCIEQFVSMTKRNSDLKKYQIVMATIQPIEELAAFDKKYQLSKYPYIITGQDSKFFFPTFFQISNFPYLAFYNRSGRLISTYEGNMSVDNMLKRFN